MKTSSEIAKLIQENMSSAPGVKDITVDGIRITIDRDSLDFWEKRAAREIVPIARPIAASIDLSS